MICVFIIWREHPKAHRKWFYVVLWFYGEAGNRTCDPWFTRHSAYPLHHGGLTHVFVAVFLGCTSTGRVGLCFLWFCVQELPKAQLAVILVLKRLRRRGNGLKSHPTDWEKPGIEPATPGLQDIGLSPTPRRLNTILWWLHLILWQLLYRLYKYDFSNNMSWLRWHIFFSFRWNVFSNIQIYRQFSCRKKNLYECISSCNNMKK